MIQDRDPGDENDRLPTRVEQRFTCERCGEPVTLAFYPGYWLGLENVYVIHDGCAKAQVTMTVHHPRRLGVITGIT